MAIDLSVSVTGKHTVLCSPVRAKGNRSSSSAAAEPTRAAARQDISFTVPTAI